MTIDKKSRVRVRAPRTLVAAITVVLTVMGFTFLAPAAHADGPCADPASSGWHLASRVALPGATMQVWRNGAAMMVRGANLQANGKSNLVIRVGTFQGGQDLGISGMIGVAPNGGWCSDIVTGGSIYAEIGFDVAGGHAAGRASASEGSVTTQVSMS